MRSHSLPILALLPMTLLAGLACHSRNDKKSPHSGVEPSGPVAATRVDAASDAGGQTLGDAGPSAELPAPSDPVPLASGEQPAATAEPLASPPPPPVGVGPTEPERWKVLKGGEGDTIAVTQRPAQPLEIVDTILQASTRTALICFETRGPFVGTTIRNSILRVEPGTIPLDRSYWAFRGYDMIDTLVERSEITGFGRVTPRHDEGHAIYLNVAGSFTLVDSFLHHNGGQAVQLVNRPAESVLPAGPAAGEIRIENTRIAENGFNPDRGGFQVSIFGTGQPVTLRKVEISAGQDETEFDRDRTGGGLLIEAEAAGKRPVWWKPAKPDEDWTVPFTQGPTLLQGVTIIHRNPNKPIVQIKGCEELIVENSWFEGGKVVLDHPAKPGRNSGKIIWRGNGGDAELFLRGRRLGLVGQDFEVE